MLQYLSLTYHLKPINMKKLLMIALSILTLAACKKDEPVIVEPVEYPVYGNLKVGNYWIYQRFVVDTNGVETPLDKFDTCFVEKDTVVDGLTFYKIIRPSLIPRRINKYFWRESEGKIYDIDGIVRFSADDFTTIFDTYYSTRQWNNQIDTLYVVTSKMVDKNKKITTPGGNFFTCTYQTKYEMSDLFEYRTRYSNTRFCRDIGIVSETMERCASPPAPAAPREVGVG